MLQHARQPAAILFPLLIAVSLGCQGNTKSRYTPTGDVARKAVESALSQWKSGAKYGSTAEATPPVIVEEPRWKSGMRLNNYTILEEIPGKDYPRFKVKLNFAGKPELDAEYVVAGIDPPIVYSKEEFDVAGSDASGM